MASQTSGLRKLLGRLPSRWLPSRTGRLARRITVVPRDDLVRLGTPGYGYWVIPRSLLGTDSICYLAGTGTDISFDLAVIDRFGCTVHAFDPVPAAAGYVEDAARHEPRFVFHSVGLWSSDATLAFHGPARAGWISHSATNIHETDVAFETPVRSVKSLMAEYDHDHLDLLKLSVEGSEFEILKSLERDGVMPRVICVEFAQPAPDGEEVSAYERLMRSGYTAVAADVSRKTAKLTFVHEGGSSRD